MHGTTRLLRDTRNNRQFWPLLDRTQPDPSLVASILYLSQFRAGLIDARAQSLLVQAEIIAGAIAASATVETNTITIDPERLADLKPGETYGAAPFTAAATCCASNCRRRWRKSQASPSEP